MLVFKIEMRVNADKWSNNEEKEIFMKNAEEIVQEGLNRMTVPDWTVKVIDAEEESI